MVKTFLKSELGQGTIILFLTMNLYNFLNFLFHFSMGRMLGPANYGVLAVLMSIVYIFGVPGEAIQNLVSNYSSRFNIKNEDGKIKFLMFKFLRKGFKIALVIFIGLSIFSIFLAKFLGINFWLIFLTNILIFSSFSLPVTRGVLQGRKRFHSLGWNMIQESSLKLIFSISFVMFGFVVFGAVVGVLLGVFAGLVFSFYFNREVIKVKVKETPLKEIYPKSIPYFVSMLVILLVLSLDIILAKRFFPAELAGQYAVLSMLGKMIYFGTFAVSKAMFPLTSEKNDKKENPSILFRKSFFMVSGLCILGIVVYGLFPRLVIGILFGSQYLSVAPYLLISGIALSFLSLSNLTIVYALSTDRLKNSHFLIGFLIVEFILLFLFHSTILEYILAFMVSNIIMFIGSFLLIKKQNERQN